MTPREILYHEARHQLRRARSALQSQAYYLGRGRLQTARAASERALNSLMAANALRAFAQRQLPACDECGGGGAGWGTPKELAHLVKPGKVHIHSQCVPRGCEECLGGGVRLPSRGC